MWEGQASGGQELTLCCSPAVSLVHSLCLLVRVAAKTLLSLGVQALCSVTGGSALPWMNPSSAMGIWG